MYLLSDLKRIVRNSLDYLGVKDMEMRIVQRWDSSSGRDVYCILLSYDKYFQEYYEFLIWKEGNSFQSNVLDKKERRAKWYDLDDIVVKTILEDVVDEWFDEEEWLPIVIPEKYKTSLKATLDYVHRIAKKQERERKRLADYLTAPEKDSRPVMIERRGRKNKDTQELEIPTAN